MRTLGLLVALVLLAAASVYAQGSVDAESVYLGATGGTICRVRVGSGSPEGAVTGTVCQLYLRTDTGEVYRKLSGSGNTGWVGPSAVTKTDDTNVTLTLGGSHATGALNPFSLTLGWTGQLAIARGGLGKSSWTAHTALVGNGTSAPVEIAGCTNGVLRWSASLSDPTCDTNPTVTSATTTAGAVIGTTLAVGSKLTVNDGVTSWGNAAGQGSLSYDTGKAIVSGLSGNALSFGSNAVGDRMFLHTSGGLSIGNTTDPGATNVNLSGFVGAPSYVSQTTAWRMTAAGALDARYGFFDEMHAKSFIADLEQALAGGQIITKSVAIVVSFTCPAASGTATLTVEDLPGAADMEVFDTSDYVAIRTFSRAAQTLTVADCVGTVSAPDTSGSGTQSWTFTRAAGGSAGTMSGATVVPAGTLALDYGVSGAGYYEVNAIDGVDAVNSPYAQVVTWATSPVAANRTVRCRFGNLKGVTSVTEYGTFCGNFSGNAFVRFSDQNAEIRGIPLKLYDGGTETVRLDASVPSFVMGSTLPTAFGTGTGIWMGKDTTYKFRVGNPSGNRVAYDGDLTLVSANLTIGASGIAITPDAASWATTKAYRFTTSTGSEFGLSGVEAGGGRQLLLFNNITSGGGESNVTVQTSSSTGLAQLILDSQISGVSIAKLDAEVVKIQSQWWFNGNVLNMDPTGTPGTGSDTITLNGTTGAITHTGALTTSNTTDASSVSTGAIHTTGGVGIAKKLYVGTVLNVAGKFNVTNDGVVTWGDASAAYGILSWDTGKATAGGQSGKAIELQSNGVAAATFNTSQAARFHAYGAGTATFDASGNITSVSDERMKDIQGPFAPGLNALLGLRPILYRYTEASGLDTENVYAGFSAQNVLRYIPEAVGKNLEGMYSVNLAPLLAATVTAVQELAAEVDALRAAAGLPAKIRSVTPVLNEDRVVKSATPKRLAEIENAKKAAAAALKKGGGQ